MIITSSAPINFSKFFFITSNLTLVIPIPCRAGIVKAVEALLHTEDQTDIYYYKSPRSFRLSIVKRKLRIWENKYSYNQAVVQ